MANTDKAEEGTSELLHDGPGAVAVLASGDVSLRGSGHSPVLNPEQSYGVKSLISSHSTTPDQVPVASSTSVPSATHSPFAIPHPKRFNAVNINKKFLQKNSASSAATTIPASHATAAKAGSPAPRPPPQPTLSHSTSKLVTAKLTSTAQLSTTTGPGWSRPSSATPPVSTTPSSSSNVPPPQTLAPPPAAPQLPHAGKVIQPQPRNAIASSFPLVKKDSSSSKPAWGNTNPKSVTATSFTDNAARNDFPTAAEVAQGRVVKPEEPKTEDLTVGQVPPQEADAFRGVHLDPNAHHWDEMEEDDDNFLDNVIEFGDGRQYKVAPPTGQPLAGSTTTPPVGGDASASAIDHFATDHVRKEERFADDFDRSWPRTTQSPLALQRDLPSRSPQHASISPTSSQPSHSSVEGSRVLFNERSNRLEPYNSSSFPNRLGSTFGFSRRGAHGEPALSPTESRSSRDVPPHSPAHPVHLLQKSVAPIHDGPGQSSRIYDGDFTSRRNMERDHGPHTSGSYYGQNKVRSRDVGAPGSVHESRGTSEKRPRRLSGASFASGSIPDSQQHGSPHSSDAPFPRRARARESPTQPSSTIPVDASSPVSRAPQLSSTSQLSPITPSVLDIEGVHKTAMHLSAERAKQRRQMEEEEREKEKERARKKAAEIEARMKKAQEAATVEVIQDAVNSTLPSSQPAPDSEEQKRNERPPSLKPVARAHRNNKVPRDMSIPANEPLPLADQADSWRSKTRVQSPQAPTLVLPTPMFQSNEEPVGTIGDENLEVVDFSELGKFVGSEQASLASNTPALLHRTSSLPERPALPARPVASDFFDDAPLHSSVQKAATSSTSEQSTLPGVPETSVLASTEQSQVPALLISTVPPQETREQEPHRYSATSAASRNHASPTTPHHRFGSKGLGPFRQVTMSALDDVMSRIKGALDDMQVDAGRDQNWRAGVAQPKVRDLEPSTSSRILLKEPRWLPPALRRPASRDPEQEVFDVTGCDPPRSPRLDMAIVKMPPISRPVEAISKRQLHLLKNSSSHVRFDILSWDPPVDGMSRRDLSVNDILFKRPPLTKGNKLRCRVQLPRFTHPHSASPPKVNLPSTFPKPSMVSARSKAVDDLPTWRRGPPSSSNLQNTALAGETPPALDVTSCSPPPELPVVPSKATVAQELSAKSETYMVRPRTQPKLPAGSAVGFYRDPSSSGQDSKKAAVNFTVSSELEEVTHPSPPEPSMLLSSSTVEISPSTTVLESKEITLETHLIDEVDQDMQLPTLGLITQVDSKVSEESTERSLRTPASASFSTPWTKSPLSFSSKDSPARPPDPEHLRAVWSQPTDKEQVSAVNSLEGIADDLTALPFTIQEVKSEDGETPPPTSTAVASKISLHDVTRAFQQVPTSSNVAPHRPLPISPSTANGPITRPPNFNYPTPVQAPGAGMRPHFAAFSSPMLAHSPSPTMLYPPSAPSPIPRLPMNQLYNQPMWVPMQTQNNGAVRPVPSPYPAQMVAYPAPTPVHPAYAPGPPPQNVPPGVAGTAPSRPRGMTLLSPVLHPAAPTNMPMYNGSPVLVHPPAMIAPGPRPTYMNSGPPERGQGRSDSVSTAPHLQQPPHSQNHLPPQPVYTHVPPFSRPSW